MPSAARRAAVLLSAALLLHTAAAFKVTVHPQQTECFTQSVEAAHFQAQPKHFTATHTSVLLMIYSNSWQQAEGARLEGACFARSRHEGHSPHIAMMLYGPDGALLWSQARLEDEAHFNVPVRASGMHKLCFQSHSHMDVLVDVVYFTMAHLRTPGAAITAPKGTQETRSKEIARKEHLDEVKGNVLVVGELVDILSGEQRYLQRKLDRHMETCRSNKRRTLWYALLEVLVMSAVGCWNVYFVQSLFKGRGGPPRPRMMV